MESAESKYLLELWEKRICPFCGKTIPDEKPIGSGRPAEGRFCSLGCYDDYHHTEIIERAKKIQALAERHRNS
jgi:hypothetical protein